MNIIIANTFFKRFIGFIGRNSIKSDEFLFLSNCRRIHTYFMRIPIDIVLLNNKNQVIKVFPSFPPWRISPRVKGAVSCLEMAGGSAALFNIIPGAKIEHEDLF